jgi:predicted enzyme related to lactoylglutathione lyase
MTMANQHGDFIWYELMTPDAGASAKFYSTLLGWEVGDQPDYREIKASEGHVGGILQLTPEMTAGGAHPAWVGYILVDDVDASVASIEAAGGRTCMPARDMPGVGRFAMMFDPQGGIFYIMKPTPPADNPDAASNAFAAERPMIGHCAWNELASSDPDAAKAFYGAQFGWQKDGEMDMGPIGKYEFLKAGGGRFVLGAVMAKMPEMPVSAWTYYFRVPDIDAAVAAIKANGGAILIEPMEIPGGEFSLNAMDPQGAAFGLVGGK